MHRAAEEHGFVGGVERIGAVGEVHLELAGAVFTHQCAGGNALGGEGCVHGVQDRAVGLEMLQAEMA